MEVQDPSGPADRRTEEHTPKESLPLFTFQCTRCRKKPAIVTRGRKVFLCPDCATGSLMYDMVGSLMDPNVVSDDVGVYHDTTAVHDEQQVVEPAASQVEGPTDPWGDSG
jgi:hypothetical protein